MRDDKNRSGLKSEEVHATDELRAELERQGECVEGDLSGELQRATRVSLDLDSGLTSETEPPGLRLLLEAAHGALTPKRAGVLLGGLKTRLSEREAIARELEALGELAPGEGELDEGLALGHMSEGLFEGRSSEAVGRPRAPLEVSEGLKALRLASPSASLTDARSAALLEEVRSTQRTNVRDASVVDLHARRRSRVWSLTRYAAAAAILVCTSGALFLTQSGDLSSDAGMVAEVKIVDQFELTRAESGWHDAESEALVALTRGESSSAEVDKLRRLRLARHDLMRARVQAKARRL